MFKCAPYNADMKSNNGEKTMKNGPVQVGYIFDCVKNNGKRYTGEIVKVGAYPRGTLVTIRNYVADGYFDAYGNWYDGESPVYKSIYLEDCLSWNTSEFVDA